MFRVIMSNLMVPRIRLHGQGGGGGRGDGHQGVQPGDIFYGGCAEEGIYLQFLFWF